ncbi:MAG: HutP family protein [Clostridia bacterium]|nr:HutP family protein [Clostridia bacterium]MDD4048861.1 HutP family protein [Clostridia bacterium]
MIYGTKKIATAAIKIAMSESREEETKLKNEFKDMGIRTVAVDIGGEYITSIKKIVERAIVASKRENVIKDNHFDEGAVAGATHEALSQIIPKALGLNVGGKIGIARQNDNISVAIFLGIGLLHLDEIAIGLSHRVSPYSET